MRLAAQAYADGSIEHMQELLVKHWPLDSDREDLRGFEWDYLAAAGNLYLNVYPTQDYWPYGRIVLSPDGQWFVNTMWQDTLFVSTWNNREKKLTPFATVTISSYLDDLAFSANGEFLAEGGLDGKIRIWDCSTWEDPTELDGESLPDSEGVMSVAFSPNENILASGGKGSPIIFWDTATWTPMASLPVDGSVNDLAFARDGKSLVAGMSDGQLVLCDVSAQKIAGTVTAHRQPITSIATFHKVAWTSSPDTNLFATGSEDGTVRLWNDKLEAGEVLSAGAPITTLTFSWDGTRLAAGTAENNSVLVWDMDSRSEPTGHLPIHTVKAHARKVAGLAFHWNSPAVMWSVSEDGTNKLWNLNRSESHATIRDALPSTKLAFSADGRTLFYQDQQKVLRSWVSRGGVWIGADPKRKDLLADGESFDHLAFSDDGAAFAGTRDGDLQVWDVTENRAIYQHKVQLQPDSRVAVTLEGRRVAWTMRQDTDFDIVVHDLGTGKEMHIPPSEFVKLDQYLVHEWPVFSPEGTRLLGQRHMATFIWDVTDDPPAQRHQLNGWGAEYCGAFSPDGQTVAIGSDTYDIRLHDAESGELRDVLQGHTSPVLAVAFLRERSNDGKWVLLFPPQDGMAVNETLTSLPAPAVGHGSALPVLWRRTDVWPELPRPCAAEISRWDEPAVKPCALLPALQPHERFVVGGEAVELGTPRYSGCP